MYSAESCGELEMGGAISFCVCKKPIAGGDLRSSAVTGAEWSHIKGRRLDMNSNNTWYNKNGDQVQCGQGGIRAPPSSHHLQIKPRFTENLAGKQKQTLPTFWRLMVSRTEVMAQTTERRWNETWSAVWLWYEMQKPGSCFAALQAFADAAICTTHVTQKQKTIACGNDVANGEQLALSKLPWLTHAWVCHDRKQQKLVMQMH